MGRKKLTAGCDPNEPFLCCVCGDKARGNNFSVMSCVSCKTFFRRHGLSKPEKFRCRYGGKCTITREKRRDCVRCRLKKCLEVGMDPLMIRCPFIRQTKSLSNQQLMMINQNQIQLPAPRPLNLLYNDSSNLTREQWNLLSNIICSYDEQNIISHVKYAFEEKSALPPKLRSKSADIVNLISQCVLIMQPLIERSPHYQYLSSHARRSLVLQNVFFTGSLSGYFIARETGAFNNMNFMAGGSTVYGADYMLKCAQDSERLEPNGNLIKLMLFVLIFSSNCSIVEFNDQEDLNNVSSSIELIHTQNIYVTMLWKYLVYLYGYDQAAMRFSSLVKSVIDMLGRAAELLKNLTYLKSVDRIVTKTEHSLVITD